MSGAGGAERRGANGGGGWLHAAWLALTGATATPEQLLTEDEIAGGGGGGGGGSCLPALTARSSSRYELVNTEEPDGDETSWESTEPASETELFLLPREEYPKTTTTNSPESIFTWDELRMSKPEFWRWPAKKTISGEPESMAAVRESEPFLTRRHGANRINDVEMDDHPFSFGRHGRMESSSSPFLLLCSS